MCGIFSVISVGNQPISAADQVLAGLKRLEYRGYDSWGIAVVDQQGAFQRSRQVGQIGQVGAVELPEAAAAIGHTRWATHGGITQANAHPHQAKNGSFVLAQNGIVQNFQELKAELVATGYEFESETDTEVIVGLIEQAQVAQPATDLVELMRQVFKRLAGRNTIIMLTADGRVLAARNGSPLVVGLTADRDRIFVSSDTLSFADQAGQMIVLENNQQVLVADGQVKVWDIASGQPVAVEPQPLDATAQVIDKEGYDHFMLKEIHESPTVVRQVVAQDATALQELAEAVRAARRVFTIGSGTAGIAAAQLAYFLRDFAGIMAISLVGADAVEYLKLMTDQDLIIAPSQSGETADVLEVLEVAQAKGVKITTYVNMQGASMTRMADFAFLAEAGPEICVMSTKVFIAQVAWGYRLAKCVTNQLEQADQALVSVAGQMEKMLNNKDFSSKVTETAEFLLPKKDIFLLAKADQYQMIREGMVKLIEGSYKHAHALPAGDLKHYAITLMEQGVPVIVVFGQDPELAAEVLTAGHEVQARGASLIGVGPAGLADPGQFEQFLEVPAADDATCLLTVLPLQLLAYHLAVGLGHDVDHPRNIAKSVTVK